MIAIDQVFFLFFFFSLITRTIQKAKCVSCGTVNCASTYLKRWEIIEECPSSPLTERSDLMMFYKFRACLSPLLLTS